MSAIFTTPVRVDQELLDDWNQGVCAGIEHCEREARVMAFAAIRAMATLARNYESRAADAEKLGAHVAADILRANANATRITIRRAIAAATLSRS